MKFNNYKKSLFRKSTALTPLVLAMTLPGTAFGAVDCVGVGAWDASGVYTNGDQVVEKNHKYQAKWWTTNENPTTTGQWATT